MKSLEQFMNESLLNEGALLTPQVRQAVDTMLKTSFPKEELHKVVSGMGLNPSDFRGVQNWWSKWQFPFYSKKIKNVEELAGETETIHKTGLFPDPNWEVYSKYATKADPNKAKRLLQEYNNIPAEITDAGKLEDYKRKISEKEKDSNIEITEFINGIPDWVTVFVAPALINWPRGNREQGCYVFFRVDAAKAMGVK